MLLVTLIRLKHGARHQTIAGGTRLWTMTNVNRNFVSGFADGMFYALTKLNKELEYVLADLPSGRQWGAMTTPMGRVGVSRDGVAYFLNELDEEIKQRNTILLLRSVRDNQRVHVLYMEGDVQPYLRGLFTALQGFNVPITEVLLTQPLKNGQYFNIEGLTLPQTL